MSPRRYYFVEVHVPQRNSWHFIQGSMGCLAFAKGVVFGYYKAVQAARPAIRIMCDDGRVIEEYPAKDNTPRPSGYDWERRRRESP